MHLTFEEVAALDEQRLREFVERRLPEGPYLDYKQAYSNGIVASAIPWICGFANARGGLILIGVIEPARVRGSESPIVGIEGTPEKIRAQLENCARDSIDPRVGGLCVHPVLLASGKVVLVVHVPETANGPHMNNLDHKLYLRHSESTSIMTIDEIRDSVFRSGSMIKDARDFLELRYMKQQVRSIDPRLLVQAFPLTKRPVHRNTGSTEFFKCLRSLPRDSATEEPKPKLVFYATPSVNVEGVSVKHQNQPLQMDVFRNGYVESSLNAILYQATKNSDRSLTLSEFHAICLLDFLHWLRKLAKVDDLHCDYLIRVHLIGADRTTLNWGDGWQAKSYRADRQGLSWPEYVFSASADPETIYNWFLPIFLEGFGIRNQ